VAESLLVTTTVGTREDADRLAESLVDRRLAACARVSGPVASTYRWRGAVDHATEWICELKTTRARLPALEALLDALHPYDLPELTVVPLDGSAAYLAWIEEAVRDEG
jgi:periplasmic divalent cation tolerance protein